MKVLGAVLGILVFAHMGYAAETTVLKTEKDKVSYGIGMEFGKNMKRQSIDIDPDILARGIKDAFLGEKLLLSEEELRTTMENFRSKMMAKQQSQMKVIGEKNKKEGEAFLAENKKKKGVLSLPSGLQYIVVKAGEGDKPEATDTVTVHYRGSLIDGTEFDSSYSRGQPASFRVDGVIPGWTEALQLMNTGSKWQIFIPSNLAYGERGAGGRIGPNATLIFDVELISIK
jgi:FKBP-type peptidyl-prolyl cis-trans isomerase FklB